MVKRGPNQSLRSRGFEGVERVCKAVEERNVSVQQELYGLPLAFI